MKALCGALLLLTSLVGSDAFGQAANLVRPLEKMSLRLDWSLSGFHLPFYWAARKGYFKEAGLDVEIKPGAGSQQAINLVAGGHDDLGFADLSLVASSIAKGMKIKAVFAVVQRDAWSIYSHNDRPILRPEDLVGKSVVLAVDHKPMMDLLLRLNRIDPATVTIRLANPQTRQTVFAQHSADGVLGVTMSANVTLGGGQVLSMMLADYGVLMLGQGVVASNEFLSRRGDVARRFLKVLNRAIHECMIDRNIPEAISIAMQMTDSSREATIEVVNEQWKKTIPLLVSKIEPNRPTGWMSEADWQATISTLQQIGRVPQAVDLKTIYTNEFVPAD